MKSDAMSRQRLSELCWILQHPAEVRELFAVMGEMLWNPKRYSYLKIGLRLTAYNNKVNIDETYQRFKIYPINNQGDMGRYWNKNKIRTSGTKRLNKCNLVELRIQRVGKVMR